VTTVATGIGDAGQDHHLGESLPPAPTVAGIRLPACGDGSTPSTSTHPSLVSSPLPTIGRVGGQGRGLTYQIGPGGKGPIATEARSPAGQTVNHEPSLTPARRRSAAVLGLLLATAALASATALALLLSAAIFGYPGGLA
jgi:hypothetical protein